jgi:hypothetical protein
MLLDADMSSAFSVVASVDETAQHPKRTNLRQRCYEAGNRHDRHDGSEIPLHSLIMHSVSPHIRVKTNLGGRPKLLYRVKSELKTGVV